MRASLPFSIRFGLPAGWILVPPGACGQTTAACVAVREQNAADPVATNFVVKAYAGCRELDVAARAAAYLVEMRSRYQVWVLRQDVLVGETAIEAGQLLQIGYSVGESTVPLKQLQIISAFPGVENSEVVAVLELVMTCPADIFDQAGREFGWFVSTITAPVPPTIRQS